MGWGVWARVECRGSEKKSTLRLMILTREFVLSFRELARRIFDLKATEYLSLHQRQCFSPIVEFAMPQNTRIDMIRYKRYYELLLFAIMILSAKTG